MTESSVSGLAFALTSNIELASILQNGNFPIPFREKGSDSMGSSQGLE